MGNTESLVINDQECPARSSGCMDMASCGSNNSNRRLSWREKKLFLRMHSQKVGFSSQIKTRVDEDSLEIKHYTWMQITLLETSQAWWKGRGPQKLWRQRTFRWNSKWRNRSGHSSWTFERTSSCCRCKLGTCPKGDCWGKFEKKEF